MGRLPSGDSFVADFAQWALDGGPKVAIREHVERSRIGMLAFASAEGSIDINDTNNVEIVGTIFAPPGRDDFVGHHV